VHACIYLQGVEKAGWRLSEDIDTEVFSQ